jgi:hypothetical protein
MTQTFYLHDLQVSNNKQLIAICRTKKGKYFLYLVLNKRFYFILNTFYKLGTEEFSVSDLLEKLKGKSLSLNVKLCKFEYNGKITYSWRLT